LFLLVVEFPPKIKLEKRLKDYLEENVDEKYYISNKAIEGLMRANEREHTPTWLNREEPSPTIDTRVGALCHYSPYVIEPICLNSKVDGKQPSLQDRIYDSEGISTAITTGFMPSVTEPTICAMRGRNPQNPKSRESGLETVQMIEPKFDGTSNTLTTVQKDNMVIEPYIVVKEATEQGYAEAYEGDSINLAQPNSKTRRGRVGKQVSQTLTTLNQIAVVEPNIRIRKLTPLECWRLMGIDDECFRRAEKVCSNSQLYKQAGNGIVVDVFAAILSTMKGTT